MNTLILPIQRIVNEYAQPMELKNQVLKQLNEMYEHINHDNQNYIDHAKDRGTYDEVFYDLFAINHMVLGIFHFLPHVNTMRFDYDSDSDSDCSPWRTDGLDCSPWRTDEYDSD